MFIGVTLFCMVLGFVVRPAEQQRKAVEALRSVEGITVLYEFEVRASEEGFLEPLPDAAREELLRLAEAHDLGDLMDLTREDFRADPGARGRTEAKRILFAGFKRYGNFRLRYPRSRSRCHSECPAP